MDFFREKPSPSPAACIFSAGRNFLKIQYKPRGHPCETGSPPPPPRRTSPFSRWRRGLVTMAILLLDRWLQPPPTTLPQHPPSPPDSFVLPATGTTNQSRTAKKYSITRQELEGGGGGGGSSGGGVGGVGFASVVVAAEAENRITLETPLVFTPPSFCVRL